MRVINQKNNQDLPMIRGNNSREIATITRSGVPAIPIVRKKPIRKISLKLIIDLAISFALL